MEDVTPSPPRTPWVDPRTVAIVATAVVFTAFVFAGLSVQPLNVAFGIWFTEIFVFFGLGWYVLRITGRHPARYTGLSSPSLASAAFGFVLGVVNFFAIVAPVQFISQSVLPKSWQQIYDMASIFQGQTPVELALIVASVSIGAPVCEEFFFRGILFQGLKAPGGPPQRALVLSAVVFSLFHLDPVGFLARVELGMLFGWLLLRTGSVWPGILAHAANNLVSTVLFFFSKDAEPSQVPTSKELLAFLFIALVGNAALAAVLAGARRFPSLLGGPPRPEVQEAPEGPAQLEPFPLMLRRAVPWVLAAALSLGAYVALDSRGIQLSVIDQKYQLRPVPRDAPDALQAEREALRQLRIRARRGEVPIEAYAQERARQSRQKRLDVPQGRDED